MAGLLLWAVCASMTGCLFPQDDQVLPELPPKRNSPIRILDQDPPAPRTTFFNGTACGASNPAFKLTVDDEDVADTVRSRWFVGLQSFEGRFVSSTGSRGREVTAPTDSGFRATLANLTAGDTELLTVFVSDTEARVVDGKLVVEPRSRVLPDGTPVEDKGYSDSFTWVLDVEACSP
jgi:hypothetical protein